MSQTPIRLAFRQEGDFWVAYCAETETMSGAFELGRVHMRIANHEPQRQAFIDLMTDALRDIIRELYGVDVADFETKPGPDHERAGA